tara:strand:+ start:1246 stop:1746 length:501 start_codon:yes stop_codon:yes gene_type:complete
MDSVSVLKLDSSFKPIEVVSWQEAFVLTYVGKAWAVEYSDQWVNSATKRFKVPLVIALYQFIDEKFFKLPCTRKNVIVRDNYECQYCDQKFNEKELTLDHVIPRSKGGPTSWDNVVAACKKCNQAKANYYLKDCSMKLQKKPSRPSFRALIKRRFQDSNNPWVCYL